MSYLSFLLYFILAPTVVLALGIAIEQKRKKNTWPTLSRHWLGTLILALIAIVWTTPWDNAIVARGVWSYGVDRVIGTLGVVPVEEYAFMFLMPFLNAAALAWFMRGTVIGPTRWRLPQPEARRAVLLLATALGGAGLLLLQFEPGIYFGAILIWFTPPLALQACFDPSTLLRRWRIVAVGTLLPTFYLSLADAYAIGQGIWTIHPETRTGLGIGILPFEEILFFFTTSLLIVQGLVLWHSLYGKTEA
jgi:lycopene beta-cyclase